MLRFVDRDAAGGGIAEGVAAAGFFDGVELQTVDSVAVTLGGEESKDAGGTDEEDTLAAEFVMQEFKTGLRQSLLVLPVVEDALVFDPVDAEALAALPDPKVQPNRSNSSRKQVRPKRKTHSTILTQSNRSQIERRHGDARNLCDDSPRGRTAPRSTPLRR